MKEIWINLELYIKRYDFYNLGNFFRIFKLFYFILFSIFKPVFNNKKNKNKNKKWAQGPHGCDVACKATWQRHTDPRNAYVARDI